MDTYDDMSLPADTLQLLADFAAEQDANVKAFEDLKLEKAEDTEKAAANGKLTMDVFTEDWNASQFWYTDATARVYAEQLLEGATSDSSIAIVSTPSVYVALRNVLHERGNDIKPRLCLLEYDKRFEVFGPDFVPYDFRHPLRLPSELKGRFDRIICDPPFLSDDCQTKIAMTIRYLAQSWSATPIDEVMGDSGLRFIAGTGAVTASLNKKLYSRINLQATDFEPEHRNGLSNEWRCYANFECDAWKWE
ncbi:N-6 adenine-specific DNA methyltransferase-like protein 2 [Hortaea werneckii]|nr:N-6 adenine-specific DNA methyltransferase-like protein 2 [Hortaea werneckii]